MSLKLINQRRKIKKQKKQKYIIISSDIIILIATYTHYTSIKRKKIKKTINVFV